MSAPTEWVWCARCERVYPLDKFIHYIPDSRQNYVECPNPECDRSRPVQVSPWSPYTVPRYRHPDYPDIPIEGERYARN